MGISDTGSAGLGCGPADHEPGKVHHRLVAALLLLLVVSQALLQELVDDKVDDGLADAPPGGSQTLPESTDTLR